MLPKSAFNSMLAGLAIMLNLSACTAQADKKHAPTVADQLTQAVDSPHVEFRVNKQYDAQGTHPVRTKSQSDATWRMLGFSRQCSTTFAASTVPRISWTVFFRTSSPASARGIPS